MFPHFLKDRRASVIPLLAFAVVPIFAATGAAVDYSRANNVRTAMQAAVDATVLAMAKDAMNVDASQLNAKAIEYFNTNFLKPELENLHTKVAASSTSNGYSVAMSAVGKLKTRIMGVVGISIMNVSVNATAVSYADGLGCVLSLDPHRGGAINTPGTALVDLIGCSLYDNSDDATALTAGGSAQINARSVGVVGGLSGESNITTTNGIRTKIGAVDDPYADVNYSPFSGCTEQNFTAHTSVTINPGVYCGGMMINAGANVTLNSGIYYLDGGSLTVNGGATVTGDGVTLVFTSQNRTGYATASINGGATINLTPPIAGPTAGVVMFGDRQMPTGSKFSFNGGAGQNLAGAVYIPKADLIFSGGLTTNASCTQLIAGTVTFTGNAALGLDCSDYAIKRFSPVIVKLTS